MSQASIELTQGVRRPAALRLLPDDRLARRAAEGDRGAFAVIFERHHQGLYRYCRAILRHDEDARDALQTTFTRAIAALDGEERAVAIKPWLYRIAHNEAISLLRRRRPLDPLDELPDVVTRTPGPDDRALSSERMRQLLADLEQLPERQRWALLLRELNDLTYADIAAAITTTEQAARQSVYEARVMLMELKDGREMPCAEVLSLISERDGRLLRPRKVRAHLKACEPCTEFRSAIGTRRADLGTLAPPLPTAAAAALLSSLLGGGGGGGWGGGGLAAALTAGKGVVAAAGSKGLATAAALTIAGGALVTTSGTIPAPGPERSGDSRPAALEAHATRPAATTTRSSSHVSAGFHGSQVPTAAAPDDTPATTLVTHVPQQTGHVPQVVSPEEQAPAPAAPHATEPGSPAPPATHVGESPAGAGKQRVGRSDRPASTDAPRGGASRPTEDAERDEMTGGGYAHSAGNGSAKAKAKAKANGDEDHSAHASSSSRAPRSSTGRAAALESHVEAGRDNTAAAMRRRDDDERDDRYDRYDRRDDNDHEPPGNARRGDEDGDEDEDEDDASGRERGRHRTNDAEKQRPDAPGQSRRDEDHDGDDAQGQDDGHGRGDGAGTRDDDARGGDKAPGKSEDAGTRDDDAAGKSADAASPKGAKPPR